MQTEEAQQPAFSFFYDTIADDLGHLGFSNTDPKVQFVYNEYNKMLQELLQKYGANPDYLIIIVTDHGRDPDGKGHSWHDKTENGPRNSWTLSNVNLDDLINTDNGVYRNFYDIKEAVFNWLFKI